MSLNRLSRVGTVCSLDAHSGYWSEHADSLYGRALIVHNIIPSSTVACMRTALWVWMGGMFPETVDVLSGSHYRTTRHSRPICAFARRVEREHVMKLGELNITSPSRTACDIATMANRRPGTAIFADRVADLMHAYCFTPEECNDILDMNPCIGTMPHAKAFLNTARMYYEERNHARVRGRPVDDGLGDGISAGADAIRHRIGPPTHCGAGALPGGELQVGEPCDEESCGEEPCDGELQVGEQWGAKPQGGKPRNRGFHGGES